MARPHYATPEHYYGRFRTADHGFAKLLVDPYGLTPHERTGRRGDAKATVVSPAGEADCYESILVPLFLVLNAVGMTNTLIGLSVIYITFQLPFGIFMMRNAFDNIPKGIEKDALVDGCNVWAALMRVRVPVVIPGIVTVVVSRSWRRGMSFSPR